MGLIKRRQESKSHKLDSESAQAGSLGKILAAIILAAVGLLWTLGCAQKQTVQDNTASIVLNKPTLEFFEQCSRIDTRLDEIWILLCQKENHPFRQELYEYSKVYKKFRRLTFQDGVITDLAVQDVESIFYSSTYDQAKEQFVEVLKGQQPGTDIYLKKRNETSFERLTTTPGQEKFLSWSPDLQKLYFVHSANTTDQIASLDGKNRYQILHIAKASEIISPVVLPKEKNLYWIEDVASQKKYWLYKRVHNKVTPVFTSDSKIQMIKPDSSGQSLLVAFSTGLGGEIWQFTPGTQCWQLRLRTQTRWSVFEVINENEVFLSLDNGKGLQLQTLIKHENSCEPSPPGLGVENPT